MTTRGPLHGIRVLDITRSIAGPWATRMLCDAGAEVIKVEPPPTGDFIRLLPITLGPLTSGYFVAANSGKKSLCIDLRADAGRRLMLDLAERCDIVVQNLRPLAARRLGLTYDVLRARRKDVVFCSISGYGSESPLVEKPGQDIAVQCITGVAALSGQHDGPTSLAVWSLADTMTSVQAYSAICSAVLARAEGAGGCAIDIAMSDCTLQFHDAGPRVLREFGGAIPIARLGRFHPFLLVRGVVEASDGYLALSAYRRRDWRRLAGLLGDPFTETRFDDPRERLRQREAIVARLDEVTRDRSSQELMRLFAAQGLTLAPVRGDLHDVVADERFLARQSLVPVPTGEGTWGAIGSSVINPDTGSENIRAGAPLLGQHTGEVLRDVLGYDRRRIFQLYLDNVLTFDPDILGEFIAEFGGEG
jgi:glutaryl-CoA transferase